MDWCESERDRLLKQIGFIEGGIRRIRHTADYNAALKDPAWLLGHVGA